MKIVALGVTQGHRLRFVAEGEDAKQAIEALGKVIADGLGENVSAVPPSEPDTIEIMGKQIHAPAVSEDHNLPANAIEAVFVIKKRTRFARSPKCSVGKRSKKI